MGSIGPLLKYYMSENELNRGYEDVSISMDMDGESYVTVTTQMPYDYYISSRGNDTSYSDNKIPVIQQSIGMMRNCGTSEWILKSSIVNPECIIVYRNENTKQEHERKFERLVSQDPVFNGLYEHNERKRPIFTTIDNLMTAIRGKRLPLIFDPECFL
jgi:hypothetical protein